MPWYYPQPAPLAPKLASQRQPPPHPYPANPQPKYQPLVPVQHKYSQRGPVHPKPGPIHPQPGPVYPKPGPVHPKPGPIHPQSRPVYLKPGPVHPQPGPLHPQPSPVYTHYGPVHPLPGPIYPQPGPSYPEQDHVQPAPHPRYPGPSQKPGGSGGCLKHCAYVPDGDYQSCSGCNFYVSCVAGLTYDYRPCPAYLCWDDYKKRCEFWSSTCDCKARGGYGPFKSGSY
ncbi:uncharacterized protein LOC135473702 [Liolophura sinensis]|uniref:uncharacterized protein LOC135473702 n=1 Tax=Liolophura sinensis TaxID=3198878 RepID=UPI003157FCF8